MAGRNLANEAKAAKAKVKDKQGINGQPDPVLDHTAAAENADTSCQRPGDEEQVDRDSRNLWHVERREQGRNDEREEGVANDADALREGAVETN